MEQNEIIYGVLKHESSGLTLNQLIISGKYFFTLTQYKMKKTPVHSLCNPCLRKTACLAPLAFVLLGLCVLKWHPQSTVDQYPRSINLVSIITQVIIEILEISLAENGVIFHLVNVSEEEINLMEENAIPRNTKHATKFGMTLFKGKV